MSLKLFRLWAGYRGYTFGRGVS